MTFKAKAMRVLPAYKDLLSDYLGMAQIIGGMVTLIFGITAYAVRAFTSSASSAILAAITLILCGIFGILAGMKKELWAVTLYFLSALMALVFALVLFGSAITAISYEDTRNAPSSVTVREAIDICLICLGMLSGSSCILSLLLTGLSLFTDSCKCVTGAKYVEEPNVAYHHNEENPATNGPSIQLNFHPSHSKHDSSAVNEQHQGNIHSFENPQAKSESMDSTTRDTSGTIEDQYGSAYPS